jgi:hypothetical protein
METFALNRLAESFEVDRSTMVRAMRHVPPDLVKPGNRPTWKTSTAARALEAHRRKSSGTATTTSTNPQLEALSDKFYAAEAAMKKLKTLPARRAAAVGMAPLIAQFSNVMRQVGLASGKEPEYADLLADKCFMLMLRSFETPCSWSQDETWDAISRAIDGELRKVASG